MLGVVGVGVGIRAGGRKQSGRGEWGRCVQIGAIVLLMEGKIALGPIGPCPVLLVVWVATVLVGVAKRGGSVGRVGRGGKGRLGRA